MKKTEAGVIQSTRLSSNYSKESIGSVYAHRNMVHKRQVSVKNNNQVYFLRAAKNWCTTSLRASF